MTITVQMPKAVTHAVKINAPAYFIHKGKNTFYAILPDETVIRLDMEEGKAIKSVIRKAEPRLHADYLNEAIKQVKCSSYLFFTALENYRKIEKEAEKKLNPYLCS